MSSSGKWDDLGLRLISGAALVAVGAAAIYMGGPWFRALTILACGLMIWELARMIAPENATAALQAGGVAALALFLAIVAGPWAAPALLAAGAVAGAVLLARHRPIYLIYALLTLVAGYGLVHFRETYGMLWLIWLVIIVVATDIFGYFAGRAFGGPKFWPSLSPKKTWSGTIAGWVAAFAIGYYFWTITDAGRDLLWISVLLSFSSQMGDIAESAIKRRMGVKDSSNLIPGHGGLLDRFDGLLGASLYMLIVAQFVVIPTLV